MNMSGWVTFRQIIDDIMLAWGDAADPGQFMRYLNFAIRGYEDLRLRSLPATKPVRLDIQGEMRIVILPEDFLKFVSVGIMDNGTFYRFSPKSDMVPITTQDCGVDTRDISDGTTLSGDTITMWVCYYSLDLDNRRLIIDAPAALTEVILNYTPTGVRMDGQTYIPRMARGVIQAYVEHQLALRDKGKTMVDKVTFEKEYLKELNMFRGLQYDPDELYDEYYSHIALGLQY